MNRRWVIWAVLFSACGCDGTVSGDRPTDAWNALEAARQRGDGEAMWLMHSPAYRHEMEKISWGDDGETLTGDDGEILSTHKTLMDVWSSWQSRSMPIRPVLSESRQGDQATITYEDMMVGRTWVKMDRIDGRWLISGMGFGP